MRDHDSGSMPLDLNIRQTSTRACVNGSEIQVFGSYNNNIMYIILCLKFSLHESLTQTPHLRLGMEKVFLMA